MEQSFPIVIRLGYTIRLAVNDIQGVGYKNWRSIDAFIDCLMNSININSNLHQMFTPKYSHTPLAVTQSSC